MTCACDPRCETFAAHRARQRAAWKTAAAGHARTIRNRRGRRPGKTYRPGMNVRQPPEAGMRQVRHE